jgi:uncharacterized YccA/Bax inhibitor family protein
MSKHSALNTFGRSGNPAFTKNFGGSTYDLPLNQRMTLDGAVNKTGILLSLCFSGAFVGWNMPALTMPAWILGMILGFVTIFRSPVKIWFYSTYLCIVSRHFLRRRNPFF